MKEKKLATKTEKKAWVVKPCFLDEPILAASPTVIAAPAPILDTLAAAPSATVTVTRPSMATARAREATAWVELIRNTPLADDKIKGTGLYLFVWAMTCGQ